MTAKPLDGGSAAAPFRITVVCLGNICRSPIGEAVLRERIGRAGLADVVLVDSAGTGDWHLGHDADPRSRRVLSAHGYLLSHRARQIDASWLSSIDLLLAMDSANHADLAALVALAPGRTPLLRMLRSFDPTLASLAAGDPALDVPDPYYSDEGAYLEVLQMIEPACDGLVAGLPALIDERRAR